MQIREREPRLSSDAVFLIPSVSYVISQEWNASLAVEFLGRWYERNRFGAANHDYEAMPIATLEYVVPAAVFGGEADRKASSAGPPSTCKAPIFMSGPPRRA